MHSLKDELAFFFSGKGMPYAKVSVAVAIIVTVIFSATLGNNYIKDAAVAVIDLDNSKFSHAFIEELNASPYIKVATVLNTPVEPKTLFYRDKYLAAIYLPAGFEKNRYSDTANNIGVFYDNTNFAQSGNIKGALNTIIASQNHEIGTPRVQSLGVNSEQTVAIMRNIALNERIMFNPLGSFTSAIALGFAYFFPSMFFCFATLGMVSRLRLERKLMLATPFALMLRLTPYCICYTVSLIVGLSVLRVLGGLVFSGSFFLLLFSVLLLSISLGFMCILFGWTAANPGVAGSRMILIVPGGFVFGGMTLPQGILPEWVQVIDNIFPLVWGFRFARDIILRGAGFLDIAPQFGGFLIYTAILGVLVCFRFYREQQASQIQNKELAA